MRLPDSDGTPRSRRCEAISPPSSGSPYPEISLGRPSLPHDRFSDGEFPGRILLREVPVEVVPILSTIIVLIGLFLKRGILNRKKPCNLAGLYRSRKTGHPQGHPGTLLALPPRYGRRITGFPGCPGKGRFFPGKAGKCLPAVMVRRRKVFRAGGMTVPA